jgi:hypothetical protein
MMTKSDEGRRSSNVPYRRLSSSVASLWLEGLCFTEARSSFKPISFKLAPDITYTSLETDLETQIESSTECY